MSLRRKLLLAQTPVFVALAVAAGAVLYAAVHFGSAPSEILFENFRSFDAGRGMLHAVEAIDALKIGAQRHGEALSRADVQPLADAFERELRLQESNVTEHGEQEATADLRRLWTAYLGDLDAMAAPGGSSLHHRRSMDLRAAIQRILQLNRDAMLRKGERARSQARSIGMALTGATAIALVLALLISATWVRRMLAPLRVLARAVERMASGDFDARIRVEGDDEVSSLAASFNGMAESLASYRQSSLGELLEANNRLESVMDSLVDAVVVYGLDGAPAAHNRVAARLLRDGFELDRLPTPLQETVRDAFERVRRSGEAVEALSLEAAVEVPAAPAPRWITVGASPIRARGEILSGVAVSLRDVSRAVRVEGFNGDLVAAAAHELRTPLTSLHMAVHLCLEQAAGPLTDRQLDLLSVARQDCERLQTVVDELLEMARLESGAARLAYADVNVGDLVAGAVARNEARARDAGKSLIALPGDTLQTVRGDQARLILVLDNLIDNAFRHATGGHRVAVGFESETDGVRIYVDDDGPGVPDEFRERVFAKFFRAPGTEKPGSGLGLSIVRDVVRAHGGEVGVESSGMGGARFWLRLPTAERRPGAAHEPSGSPSPPLS